MERLITLKSEQNACEKIKVGDTAAQRVRAVN